jgi:hypothetical protein
MVPSSCSLDANGLQEQVKRYGLLGKDAEIVSDEPRRLTVKLAADADPGLLEETLAIERSCCGFIGLEWDPETRLLAFSVDSGEHEQALPALRAALAL